jgi:uncharacterized metal-binding protein
MTESTPDFSIEIEGVAGVCPAGEAYAQQNMAKRNIPILCCEGPCIRGEIARLATNMVAEEAPFARCCYAETLLVPHSAMATWVKDAAKVVVVDGCFLSCLGRAMKNLIDEEKLIHIDAFSLYKKYSDVFLYTDVPEEDRKAWARKLADKILEKLREESEPVRK